MIATAPTMTHEVRPGLRSGRVLLSCALFALIAEATTQAAAQTHAGDGAALRIVFAAPLSGRHAAIGLAQRAALDETIATINTGGGIGGRKVVLDAHDDGCDRVRAATLARQITTPPAPPPLAVIGHPCASAAEAAAPFYQQAGVVMLAAGNRHPGFTDRRAGPLVFRVSGRDDRQGDDAAQRLRALAGKDGGIVMLHDRTVMARAITGAAARALMSQVAGGAPPPPSIGIVAGETDYARAVHEVAAARPSAILFAGFPAEAAILLRQLRAVGITAPLLMSDANATAEIAAHAGSLLDASVEVMLPVAAFVTAGEPAADEPASGPEGIAARDARSALDLVAAAARAANAPSSAELARVLAASTENRSFDARGDAVTASFAPHRRVDGAWRRVR